ncbi:Holliday junction branch migration protein RuvA [Radiobacillus kanasensis]|uniref:Holliday junction branch migration protein RuvA n=1 Tax=Radiobacillus kanasensis TaxID=2844358 RepID=UPI001E5A51AA|nr:Holliday junction branch migration protein RuvA [Radiobacillus kanasensis]UFT97900.1 Holliday junction branch migration protein RuvA [Radiobacillus kanasensis]
MIAYIRGNLDSIQDDAIYVESHGVGYEIFCTNPFVFQDKVGEEIRVYTYHYVREDAQLLFGFRKTEEKFLFKKLLNVSGIGPKGALAILGNAGVPDFVAAIEREDEKFLTSFPGVGKKTARQMILDLKGKLSVDMGVQLEGVDITPEKAPSVESKALEEAFAALRSLGYSDREIKFITPKLRESKLTTTDELIRKGLALMMEK